MANIEVVDRDFSIVKSTKELEEKLKVIKLSKMTREKAQEKYAVRLAKLTKKLNENMLKKEVTEKRLEKILNVNVNVDEMTEKDKQKVEAKISKLEKQIRRIDFKTNTVLFRMARPAKLAETFVENIKKNVIVMAEVFKWIDRTKKDKLEATAVETPEFKINSPEIEKMVNASFDAEEDKKKQDNLASAVSSILNEKGKEKEQERIEAKDLINKTLTEALAKEAAPKEKDTPVIEEKNTTRLPHADRSVKEFNDDGTYRLGTSKNIQDDIFGNAKPIAESSIIEDTIKREPVISVANMARDGEDAVKKTEKEEVKEEINDLTLEELANQLEQERMEQQRVKEAASNVQNELMSETEALKDLEAREAEKRAEFEDAERNKEQAAQALREAQKEQARVIAEAKASLLAEKERIQKETESLKKLEAENKKALEEAKKIRQEKETTINEFNSKIPGVLDEANKDAIEATKVKAKVEDIVKMSNITGTQVNIVNVEEVKSPVEVTAQAVAEVQTPMEAGMVGVIEGNGFVMGNDVPTISNDGGKTR